MILQRPKVYTNNGPVYRIDVVDTAGELGYFSHTAPIVRVIQRDACPQCGDNEEWVWQKETDEGSCPCGHNWTISD